MTGATASLDITILARINARRISIMDTATKDQTPAERMEGLIDRFASKREGYTIGIIQHLAMLAASFGYWEAVDRALQYFIKHGMSDYAQRVASYRTGSKAQLSREERIELVRHARSVQDALKIASALGITVLVAEELVQRAIGTGNLEAALEAAKYREEHPLLTKAEKTALVENALPKGGGDFGEKVAVIARELGLLQEFRECILGIAITQGCIEPAVMATLHDPAAPAEGNDLDPTECEDLLASMEARCDRWS
ncbi:hypothetical protein A2V68_03115 [candidate division Kazan bacterium RBG_13_50_9]|uniref:Uncharacterized protein n=1 Tax=candidate division Kazan bacterium RBG_13_50_9 TaxID=1798535 RepID=A0A1F4NTA2_UNCK3|nr:MAG: hypothetical protein A2V68_03115 [candidate division Kazan bacterium RBG_13_50_9]